MNNRLEPVEVGGFWLISTVLLVGIRLTLASSNRLDGIGIQQRRSEFLRKGKAEGGRDKRERDRSRTGKRERERWRKQ